MEINDDDTPVLRESEHGEHDTPKEYELDNTFEKTMEKALGTCYEEKTEEKKKVKGRPKGSIDKTPRKIKETKPEVLRAEAMNYANQLSELLKKEDDSMKIKEKLDEVHEYLQTLKPPKKRAPKGPVSDKTKEALKKGREKLQKLKAERKQALVEETKKTRAEVMQKYTGEHHHSKAAKKKSEPIVKEEKIVETPHKSLIFF